MRQLTVSHFRAVRNFTLLLLLLWFDNDGSKACDAFVETRDMSSNRGRLHASLASHNKSVTLWRMTGVVLYDETLMVCEADSQELLSDQTSNSVPPCAILSHLL